MTGQKEPRVLNLVANPQSGIVHALVGRCLTYCGRDVDRATRRWQRWGTNVVPLSDVTCGKCRWTLERIPADEVTT